MWITKTHLNTIVILSFALGGLACTAIPAMIRDIAQWRREFKNMKGEDC